MAYFHVFILLLLMSSCKSDDQLTYAKPLSIGDLLISKDGIFALGFFSPADSSRSLYVGIWFHNLPKQTVVWVANRDDPITTHSSATLSITNNSDMVLSDSRGRSFWETKNNINAKASAVLLNTGNLVLRLTNGTYLWQSFDHPTDTILSGMKFVMSYKSRIIGRLIAWKNPNDPSTGDFSFSLDPSSDLLSGMTWNRTKPYFRNGVRTGVPASGGSYPSNNTSFVYQTVIDTGDELYYMYTISNGSPYTRVTLDYTGTTMFMGWDNISSSWVVISQHPAVGSCEIYGSCGPFSYCDFTGNVPTCQCFDGFEPDGPTFSRGCRRKQEMRCGEENHFVRLPGMKVPDKFLHIRNRSLEQCASECNRDCSCKAYAYANLSSSSMTADPSRCLVWTGELVDTGRETAMLGENLYLRLADSPVRKKSKLLKIVVPIIACLLLLTCSLIPICKHRGNRKKEMQKRLMLEYPGASNDLRGENIEFPFVSFADIVAATDNFSESYLLGRGGFGKVYKGIMESGKEVAVKRLNQGSGQGIEEFRNEVVLIAKLQHKNLVRLLGCCIHEEEKLLIYEYLPNRSLDAFIFDATRKYVLDWPTRFKIIKGVARGLLYLHQDSRLTIIHRDLKASNILLDTEMTPKISDFGIARIVGGNQQANTTRVVGTYGYMSPEYVLGGAFSVKLDTYSFGVILLEIISGMKISSSQLPTKYCSLIAYAWRLWEDGNATEFVDSSFAESYPLHEVLLCIHVGLLCVQDHPNDRPLMSSVVFMLENERTLHPAPRQPVYFALKNQETEEATANTECSVNTMSTTTLEGR